MLVVRQPYTMNQQLGLKPNFAKYRQHIQDVADDWLWDAPTTH